MIYTIKRHHLIGLALILIVSTILRFTNLDSSEFWYDEATLSALAQNMAAGKVLPLLGIPSSAHIPNPPAGVYVLAIPYFFSRSPLVAVGFIALLNVIGVGLLWLIAYRYFGAWIAFVSGLLYAMSPWATLYSRKIWGQDLHTPLLLAGLVLGLYGFIEGKRWAQILCLPVLVFAMQIHFAAWALLPAYIWLLWMGRKHVSWRAVIISIILAFLTLVPFIIGLTQTPFTVGSNSGRTSLTLLPLQQSLWLITGLGLGEVHAFPPGVELVSQYPIIGLLWLTAILALGLGVWTLWRGSRPYAILLLLWGFAAPISLVSGLYPTQQHYFITSIPIFCLLMGAGVVWLATRRIGKLQLRWVTFPVVALILVTQVVDWRSFMAFVDTTYIDLPGFITQGYSTPLRYFFDIRDHVSNDVLMIAGSSKQVLGIQWSPILNGHVDCLRELVIEDGGIAVLPNHPFTLLQAPGATPYEFTDLYQSAEHIVFPLRLGEGSYTLDQIKTPPVWTGPELKPIQPAHFDNGVLLNSYRFADGRLYLDWSLPQQSTLGYKYFVNLLNVNEDKLVHHDPSFYPGKYWCANDRIITWIDLDRPAEVVTLRVGMYRLENGQIIGSNAFDAAGNAAPWVDIPLAAN